MKTALENRRESKIFASGNSLAVRLPAGWGRRGHAVILTRMENKITIEPAKQTLLDAVRDLKPLSPKFKRPKFGPFQPRLEVLE